MNDGTAGTGVRGPDRLGGRIVAAIAAATVVVRLATASFHGPFVDELYFLACGEHLAWGYVDMPPLTAVQAWITRTLLGESMLALRLLPALEGAALVLLVGLLVRRLGGGRFAQVLAATAVALSPGGMAFCSFISMNAVEPLVWTGLVLAVVRLVQSGDPRWWLLFGAIAGIGLLNKHTVVVCAFALVAGLVLTRERRLLASPWLVAGGAVAFALFVPNLLWMVEHGFPHLEQLANIRADGRNVELSPLTFFAQQLLFSNPVASPIWLGGLVWLFGHAGDTRYRALAWAYPIALVTLIAAGGRVYYLGSIYPALFAAGGVAFERWLARPRLAWLRPVSVGVVALTGAALAPAFAPVLPPETTVAYLQATGISMPRIEHRRASALPQLLADRMGWQEMAEAVVRAYRALPAEDQRRCAIFGQDYGQAGAIDLYGPRLGLPKALSGHLTYWYWGPRGYTGEVMLVMGDSREELLEHFEVVEPVGEVGHPLAMASQHFTLHLCRKPRGWTLDQVWPQLKEWS